MRSGSCHPVRHVYMVGCCASSSRAATCSRASAATIPSSWTLCRNCATYYVRPDWNSVLADEVSMPSPFICELLICELDGVLRQTEGFFFS